MIPDFRRASIKSRGTIFSLRILIFSLIALRLLVISWISISLMGISNQCLSAPIDSFFRVSNTFLSLSIFSGVNNGIKLLRGIITAVS